MAQTPQKSNEFHPFTVRRYQMLERLGSGSFSIVYKARHEDSGNLVAVKRLIPSSHEDGSSGAQIYERDKILFELHHPNIVQGVEAFEEPEPTTHQPLYYIVMELLEGWDLQQYVKEYGRLPLEDALRVFEEAADALAYALEHGVLHRDIKPSNIYLCHDGTVKLLDFGIGKVAGAEASTAKGIPGTLEYVAPDFFLLESENFRGDERSDLFSFGVCFYESLTGHRPFPKLGRGEIQRVANYVRWAEGHSEQSIDFSPHVFSEHPGLAPFITLCLTRERNNRLSSFFEAKKKLASLRETGKENTPRAAINYTTTGIIGNYRKVRRLTTTGAFARIWLAEPVNSPGATVVLKILREELQNEENIQRFEQAAQLLKGLSDCEFIVQCLDSFSGADEYGQMQYCMVLEYLDGPDLEQTIAKHPDGLPLQAALTIFHGIASALAYAHGCKVVHRDIKPDNIICIAEDKAKLIDFGVAHDAGKERATQGGIKGAWDYIPPDYITQSDASGENFSGDPASDIYSFGVCFYRALTGQLPYPHLSGRDIAVAARFVNRAFDLSIDQVDWDYPCFKEMPELKGLLEQCLEPNHDVRLQDITVVQNRLQAILDSFKQTFLDYYVVEELVGGEEYLLATEPEKEPEYRAHLLHNDTDLERARELVKQREQLSQHVECPAAVLQVQQDETWYVMFAESRTDEMPRESLRQLIARRVQTGGKPLVRLCQEIIGLLHPLKTLHDIGGWHGAVSEKSVWVREESWCLGKPVFGEKVEAGEGQASDIEAIVRFIFWMFGTPGYEVAIWGAVKSCRPGNVGNYLTPPAVPGECLFSMVPETGRILVHLLHGYITLGEAISRFGSVASDIDSTPYKRRVVGANRVIGGGERGAAYDLDHVPLEQRYEIIDPAVDKGGCGVIGIVRRLTDGRKLAAKRPTQESSRFTSEVETLRCIRHDNIVEYIDDFEELDPVIDAPRPWLVMEFLDGESLQKYLVKHKDANSLPILHLFVMFAAGVQHCHEKGVIHRDIKLSNLFVTTDGIGKLLDFGIAREQRGTATDGAIPGTCEYMAPELGIPSAFGYNAEDFRGDERSDIFSLGVCLYRALSGRSPFKQPLPNPGKDSKVGVRDHYNAYRKRCDALRKAGKGWFVRDNLSDNPDLLELLTDALAPQPQQRPASMQVFRKRLEDIIESWDAHKPQRKEPSSDEKSEHGLPTLGTLRDSSSPPLANTPEVTLDTLQPQRPVKKAECDATGKASPVEFEESKSQQVALSDEQRKRPRIKKRKIPSPDPTEKGPGDPVKAKEPKLALRKRPERSPARQRRRGALRGLEKVAEVLVFLSILGLIGVACYALLPPFFYQRELNVIVGDISSAESYLSLARLGDRLAAVAPSEDQKRRFRMYRRSVDHFVEAGAQRLGEWMTAELLLDGGKLELARQNFGVSGDEDEPLEEAAILIKAINGVGSGQLSSIDLNHWSEQLKVLRTEALESRNVRLLSAVDGLAKKTTDAGMEQLRTDVAADPLEVPVDRICSLVTASGQPDVLRGKIEALYVKELGKVLDDLSEPVAEDRLREFQSRCKQVELNSLGIVEAALNSRTVPGVDNKWIQRLESICAVFYHDAGSEEVTRFREIYQNTERAWRARLTRENPWPDENAWRQWLVDLDVYLQLFEKGELKVSPWGRTEMGQVIEDGSAYLKNRFEQEWENPEVKNWLADLEHWKDAMDNLREMDLLSDSHHDRILLDLCKASAEKIRVWAAGAVDGTSIKLRGAVAGYMDVPSVELAEAIVEAANHVAELADAQWPDEWLERWRQFIPAENPAEEEAGRVLLSTLGRQGPLYAKVSEEKRNAVNKIRSFDGNAWKSLRQRTGVLVALPLGYGGAYRGLSIEMQEAADEKLRQALKDALSKCEAVDFNNIPTPKLLATLSSGQTPDELQKSLESYRLWTEDKEDILEKYAQFVNALATWNTEQLEKSSAEFLRACPKGTDGSPEAAVKAVQAVEKAQNETLQAESMKKHQLALEGLAEALSALPREDKKTKAFAEDVAKTQKAVTEYNKSPSAENLLALYNDWYAAYPPMRKTLHLEMDAFVKPLENALKQSSDSGWLEEYSKLPLLPGQYRNEKGGRLKNIGETLFGKLKKLITSAESPESRMERLAAVENALPKGTKGCLTEEQLNALKKALAEEWRVMVVQAPDYDDELWTLSVDTRKLAPGGTVRVNHDCEASWNWLNQDNFQEKHEIRFTRGGYYSLPNEQRIPEAVKKAVLTVARERNDKILAALDTVFAFDVKDTVVDGDGSTFVQHGKRHYEIPFPFSCAGISKPEWPVPDQIVKDVLGGASFQWFQSWEANGSLKNDTLTQRLSELQSRAFGTDEQDQKKLLEYTLVVLGWSGQSAEIAKYQAYLPALRFQLYAEIGSKLDRVVYKQVPKEKLKEWQDVLTKLAQSKRYNLFNPRQEGLFQKFLGQQL